MKKKLPLHILIFIGMFVGVLAGIIVRQFNLPPEDIATISKYVRPIGQIFLRMIFMMVIPLILSALILGVAEFGDLGKLGRVGFKMLKYTLVVSTISVLLGVGMVTLIQPGKGLSDDARDYLTERFQTDAESVQGNASEATNIMDIVVNLVPKNPIEDMSRAFDGSYRGGGLLAVMFFALILGIALSASDQGKVRVFKEFLEGLYEVTMKVIGFAMKLAPFGVAALLFVITVELGGDILKVLIQYVLVVIGALAIHLFITYSIILKFFSGMSPRFFFKNVTEVMLTAFSTSSSNATLPTAIKASIEKLKLPKDITHFILTIGSTANQNGTALYEGITILFLAQCFNVDLSFGEQIIVLFTAILAGMGTAGVPGGSLPVIALILVSIHVPGESIALIIGVDRILDMSRTVLNVVGDITAAVYINHQEEKTRNKDQKDLSVA